MSDDASNSRPPAAPADPTFDGWDKLDWKQRRERRFQRWLSAPGVAFQSEEARKAYQERVQMFVDVICLKKPARVPVNTLCGYYVGKYSGLSKKEFMYDYEKAAAAVKKFHDDFQPDYQVGAVAPARVYEKLGLNLVQWPGGALADDTPWQYVEGEYMGEDEYDALITDPETYFRRMLLPRFGSAFGALGGLSPFTDMMESTTMLFSILPFADPAVVDGIKRLHEAAQECLAWLMTVGAAGADAAARLGMPRAMAGFGKAPYDILADTLRGTKGIMMDRFRRPEKILEASERLTPVVTEWGVRQAARSDAPLITFVLHKGADSFMSDADFKHFYWPTLKRVMLGLIEQGVVPFMFVEGAYNKRLDVIADEELPEASVVWLFDQTDIFAAKRAVGGRQAIAGNVPTALLALAEPADVKKYVTDVLEGCAKDGGLLLQNGAVLDDAKAENLKTMIDTVRGWKG